MEDKQERNNTVLLTVIGAATLLVAVVGATFAYFSATITGNKTDTNVHVATGAVGAPVVTFPDGTDLTLNGDLRYADRGEPVTDSITVYMNTDATLPMHLSMVVTDYTNDFCHYHAVIPVEGSDPRDTNVCFDDSTITAICYVDNVYNSAYTTETQCNAVTGGVWTAVDLVDVSNEVSYMVEQCPTANISPEGEQITCTSDAWTSLDFEYDEGYTPTGVEAGPFPSGDVTTFKIIDRGLIPGINTIEGEVGVTSRDYLFRITATLQNEEARQNYNQGKTLHASVDVSL